MSKEKAKSTLQKVTELFNDLSPEVQQIVNGVLELEQATLYLKRPPRIKSDVVDLVRRVVQ